MAPIVVEVGADATEEEWAAALGPLIEREVKDFDVEEQGERLIYTIVFDEEGAA